MGEFGFGFGLKPMLFALHHNGWETLCATVAVNCQPNRRVALTVILCGEKGLRVCGSVFATVHF